MANIVFHNNTVSLNDMWYDSHAQLVRMVAFDLKASSEQIDELLEKYVGKKQKMKAQKNPFQPKKPKSSYFYFCDDFRPKLIEKFHKKHPNEKGIGHYCWHALHLQFAEWSPRSGTTGFLPSRTFEQ